MEDLILTASAPFRLKWPGGKRWLADRLHESLDPAAFADGLCEPFAGGAALFFKLQPSIAWLGDSNPDLITTYEALRDSSARVASALQGMPISRELFDEMRRWHPVSNIDIATRMIYLNRTAFGGLWRVNRQGDFNVPFGCKSTTTMPSFDELKQTSALFQNVAFEVGDFAQTLKRSDAATVFLDPPYASGSRKEVFVRYSIGGFTFDDQRRVASEAHRLASEGRNVIVSNAYHPAVRALYDRATFKAYVTARPNNFAAASTARGHTRELVLLSKSIRVVRLGQFVPITL